MIVLQDRRLVIVTPPKTASTALHQALCGPGRPGLWLRDAARDKHLTSIPEPYRDWPALITVRNPFDRVVSLWHDYARVRAYWGKETPSFGGWAMSLPDIEPGTEGHWFWTSRQTDLHSAVPSAEPVRIEDMPAWLPRLGLSDLPRVNPSWRRPTADYYHGAAVRDYIAAYYASDFARYGY
jgi:hypothetical protein